MDDFLNIPKNNSASGQLFLAVVGSSSASGTTLQINGQAATTTKFKRLQTGQSLSAGDMVLVARLPGGYVVIGKIAY